MKSLQIYLAAKTLAKGASKAGVGLVFLHDATKREYAISLGMCDLFRAEILAVNKALELVTEPCEITLITDSKRLALCLLDTGRRKANRSDWMDYERLAKGHTISVAWKEGTTWGLRANELSSRARFVCLRALAMKYIICRGGNKDVPMIAQRANWFYGSRHDYSAYADVHMLDVKWKKYKWVKVIEKIKLWNPVMALVPDFEKVEQRSEIWERIDEYDSLGVQEILICPKYETALCELPNNPKIVIAISVPAPDYAGYIPPLEQIRGQRIHLLGGNPKRQADMIRKVNGAGGIMSSLDANGFVREARRGKFWQAGRWVQLRDKKHNSLDLAVDSVINMQKYFEAVLEESQPSLF